MGTGFLLEPQSTRSHRVLTEYWETQVRTG